MIKAVEHLICKDRLKICVYSVWRKKGSEGFLAMHKSDQGV